MTVKDIEKALAELPHSELVQFAAWFEEFESQKGLKPDNGVAGLSDEIDGWESASDQDLMNFEQRLAELP